MCVCTKNINVFEFFGFPSVCHVNATVKHPRFKPKGNKSFQKFASEPEFLLIIILIFS